MYSTLNNNDLVAIYGQQHLCGSFGIQVGDNVKFQGSPRPWRVFLRKQTVPRWMTHSLTMVLSIDPEIILFPYELSYSPVGLGPPTRSIPQNTWEESCLPILQIIGPSTLVLAMGIKCPVTQFYPLMATVLELLEARTWNLILVHSLIAL